MKPVRGVGDQMAVCMIQQQATTSCAKKKSALEQTEAVSTSVPTENIFNGP